MHSQMKKPVLKLFTVLLSGITLTGNVNAQVVRPFGDLSSFGQYEPGQDLVSALTEVPTEVLEAKKERTSVIDLEIKASRIHVDLNSEQQVEFSAKTGWATDFVWKFGDGSTVSGFQNVSHQFKNPGSYKVTLFASNETETARKDIEIHVIDNASPLELKEMHHYIVFPHDNKLEADIQLNLPRKEKHLRMQIQDVEGNPVFEYEIGRVKKRSVIHVDLRNLENGKYYAVLKGRKYSLVSKLTVTR